MNILKRVGLFSRSQVGQLGLNGQKSRKLYTDSIYPYPFNYVNSKYPGQFCYRETFINPPWIAKEVKYAKLGFIFFWTLFWSQCFMHPEAFTGHWHYPEPEEFTDEELGIPPDSAGSYYDWLAARETNGCP